MPKFYSVEQVAKLANMSKEAVYNAVKSGRIKTERAGRTIIVTEEQLIDFLSITPHPNRSRPRPDIGCSKWSIKKELGVEWPTVRKWQKRASAPNYENYQNLITLLAKTKEEVRIREEMRKHFQLIKKI